MSGSPTAGLALERCGVEVLNLDVKPTTHVCLRRNLVGLVWPGPCMATDQPTALLLSTRDVPFN
eukprot:12251364-Prorocentrum_lima.AAC.1